MTLCSCGKPIDPRAKRCTLCFAVERTMEQKPCETCACGGHKSPQATQCRVCWLARRHTLRLKRKAIQARRLKRAVNAMSYGMGVDPRLLIRGGL